MSENWKRYHRPYAYKSKLVVDGTVDMVKKLKASGKTFAEIGEVIGKTRQRAAQIYYKSIANKDLYSYNVGVCDLNVEGTQ